MTRSKAGPNVASGFLPILAAICALVAAPGCSDRSPAALLDQGIESILIGDYDEAIDTLETAARMAETDPSIHANLGIAYWKAGRLDEASNEINTALLLSNTPDEELLHIQARIHLSLGTPENASIASIALNKANLINAENPVTHTYRAMVEEQLGRPEAALIHLDRALRFNPAYGPALYNKATLLEDREPERARRLYEEYRETARDQSMAKQAKQAIARINKRLAPPPEIKPPEVDVDIPPGDDSSTAATNPDSPGSDTATDPDSSETAIAGHEPGVPSTPDSPDIGGGEVRPGTPDSPDVDTPDSGEPPESAPPEPANLSTADLLANAKREQDAGNLDTALILLKRALAAEPGNANALWQLAELYSRAGKHEMASATYKRFAEAHPDDPRSQQVALEPVSNDPPATTPPGRRVVIPASPATSSGLDMYRLGVEAQKEGRINSALQYYLKAVAHDPDLASAHYNMGLIYKEATENPKAIEAFQNALRVDDSLVKARYMLALVYRVEKRNDRALNELNEVIRVDPSFDKAYYVLALVYRDRREPQSAINMLEKLLSISPDDRDAHFLIGFLYDETGARASLTRQHYERYLELAPTGPYASNAENWLKRHR